MGTLNPNYEWNHSVSCTLDGVKKREQASSLQPRCDQLPQAPAAVSSLPWWAVMSTEDQNKVLLH